MPTIISRDQAHAVGLPFFYTGVRCLRGHDSERYTSNGTCKSCALRHKPPGPSLGMVNVRPLSLMAFDPSRPAPTDNELQAASAIVQRSIDDVLAIVRMLASQGLDTPQICWVAAKGPSPMLSSAAPASVGQVQRMSAPIVPLREAPKRIDPLTGFEVSEGDGYRPDPFK